MRLMWWLVLSVLCLSVELYAADPVITGAGSSFVAPLMYKWSTSYHSKTKARINYQSIGSGAGIKQIKSDIVQFGATDIPLEKEELQKAGLIQFPLASGSIVMAFNLSDIPSEQLILDAKTIAQIYSGEIKKWNDERIQALNPKLKLPKLLITVVHRADGSGTTYNFTSYLQRDASDMWTHGVGPAVAWPANIIGIGGTGNEGITSLVKRAPGAIGYVEYSYALANGLKWARIKTGAKLAQPEEKEWPLTATTYVLMKKVQKDKKATQEMLKFFHYAYDQGAVFATQLHYQIPSTKKILEIEKQWSDEFQLNFK